MSGTSGCACCPTPISSSAVRAGRARVVTDAIDTFTPTGVRTASGRDIEADVVVLATGLELSVLGDVAFEVDGVRVDFAQRRVYKSCMFEGVPNLISTFGYTNASWTLKADLIAGYACRLLNAMRRRGFVAATPPDAPDATARPFMDLTSGYVRRAVDRLPKQGAAAPWLVNQNYLSDIAQLRFGRIDDGVLRFAAPAAAPARLRGGGIRPLRAMPQPHFRVFARACARANPRP